MDAGRFLRAVREATPASGHRAAVPALRCIAAIIAKTHLNESIARVFVAASTRTTFPALVAAYSALLGVFVRAAARNGSSKRRT